MTNLIRLTASICALLAIGYSVLTLIIGKYRVKHAFFEKIALALPLSLGCVTVEMIVLSIFRIPFSLNAMLLPWLPVLACAVLADLRGCKKKDPDHAAPGRIRFFDNGIFILMIAVIVLQLGSVFFQAMIKPIESYDAIINFAVKAKIFFIENAVPMDIHKLEGIGKGHLDYPMLIPLVETWIYKFLGSYNDNLVKIIFPVIFTSFITAFYYSLKTLFSGKYALVFAFLLATVPQLDNFATVGYGDLTFSFMVTMAFVFLMRYILHPAGYLLTLSAVFSGIAMLTKNEGIAFVGVSILYIIMVALSSGRKSDVIRQIAIRYAAPLGVMILPWFYLKRAIGLHNTDINIAELTPARLLENISYIPFILNKFQQEVFGPKKWNILWVLVIFLPILLRKNIRKNAGASKTGVFILLNAGIYFLSYMILTGKDLYFHVNTTLSRLMIHFTGISILFLSFLVWDDLGKTDLFDIKKDV